MTHSVYTALSSVARQAPDRIAISFQGQDLTYAGLVAAVDRAAADLTLAGIAPGDGVAVYAQNCPAVMVLYYASARIGARFVPVNPALTAEEAAYTLDHSRARLVFHDAAMADQARAAAPADRLLSIDSLSDEAGPATAPDPAEPHPVKPTDDFLVIYTSGSTGTPKAVVLSHGAQVAAARSLAQMWGITADDRVLVALPLGFLYGLSTASAVALQVGAHVVLQRRFHPAEALDGLVAARATVFQGVPTMFSMMLDYADQQGRDADLSGLRLAVSAGAPLPPELTARFTRRFGAQIQNYYAMTEVTPIFGRYHDDPTPLPEGAIGRAAPLADARILRPDGSECDIGESGELIVRGAATLTRYEGSPALTAAALTPDGYFRSGDLGCRDAQGFYYITGRIKDIIIRGGANIAPAEVESVLAQHPAVQDVAVIGGPDRIFGEVPVAFIRRCAGKQVRPEELIAFAESRLAGFKVPRIYHDIDEMPLGKTGKIDKAALKLRHAQLSEVS